MATLSFGVDGPTLDLAVSLQIADTDAPRIMAYLLASPYGVVTENVQSEIPDAGWSPGEDETEDDRPTIPVQEWVSRPATPEEAAAAYARSVLDSLLTATVAHERQVAAQAAADAIAPIPVA
jgi:hypothetical protein